jgi:hypothetical protein
MTYDKVGLIQHFQSKYEWLSSDDLDMMYESVVEIFLKLKFPSNYNISVIPDKIYQRNKTWFARAMQEIIDRNGMTNVVNYKENGNTWDFGRAQLSQALIDEVDPRVSTI